MLSVDHHAPHAAGQLPAVLRVFLIAAVCLNLICLAAEFYARHTPALNHMPYTHITLDPSDDYADLRMFVDRFHHFHDRDFFSERWGAPYMYPAPVGLLYEPFYVSRVPHTETRFPVELFSIFAILTLWFRRILLKRGLSNIASTVFVVVAVGTSYPFYFEYNRGNMEIFIWLFSALGVFAFVRDQPWVAATWIGAAGACKIYPFVYLGLLIARKQYKQAAWSLAFGGLLTLFSLWALSGSVAISQAGTTAGLATFRWQYMLHKRVGEIGLDHSIFGFYKRFVPHLPPPEILAHQLTIYLGIAAVLGCVIYFARAMKLPVINQVIFLTVSCIVLPPVSYDYTLLHLYTPFLLMIFLAIDFWQRGVALPRQVWAIFLCFTLLLSPLNEFIVHGERISGQIKCILLLILAAIALSYRLVSERALLPVAAEA